VRPVISTVKLSRLLRCLVFLLGAVTSLPAGEAPADTGKVADAPEGKGARLRRVIDGILPTAWQRRPMIPFTVITEMTPEGRKRRVPTPEQPMYYFSPEGKFVQTGWSVAAGERPPPTAELEETMRKALAANGYLPMGKDQRPDVLIVFTFGSSGTDPGILAPDDGASPPITADELVPRVLTDASLIRDVIQRADMIGGEKFALALKSALDGEVRNMNANASIRRAALPGALLPLMPVNPDFGSPYQDLVRSGEGTRLAQLAEMAFHTCYFVTASAFDFRGVEKKQKIPLWQTRMVVEAQGVSLQEILKPLIANTGHLLGRDTPETVVVRKQLNRDGRVEVGTPTVVEEPKPAPTPGSERKQP
jgi:hypothetical protein